ncbi:hypothetical protein QYM36_004728 [Artemia franciscana]|uniref:PiggyBac transposable element-derived protein domain-containing protein n=1 Tax=Artemia franciscana TaxID=6661 RepID=A0AA88I6T6_ARTSF|nr:hypothetical protein QYM36_004728 [Artemia franciscana]
MGNSGDNPIGSNVPPFTEEHSVLLNPNEEAGAVDYSERLMTSEILEMMIRESNWYAKRKNDCELGLTVAFILAVCHDTFTTSKLNQGSSHSTQISKHGLGSGVAIRLCRGFEKKNAKLYFDSFFTSITITYGDATTIQRYDQTGQRERNEKKDRGSASHSTSAEGITVLRWKDNTLVSLCSSYAGCHPVDIVERWNSSEKKKVGCQTPVCPECFEPFHIRP